MSHAVNDRISLELAREIAERLPERPEWVDMARSNLYCWIRANAGSASLIANYLEWRALLELPMHELAALLVEPSDRGQRLRQNSPFAGALSPKEVWAIKERCRDDTRAA